VIVLRTAPAIVLSQVLKESEISKYCAPPLGGGEVYSATEAAESDCIFAAHVPP
jgi:hypothetical protein